MARQLKGLLYFFVTDMRYSFMIFWSILLGVLVVSLCFAYFLLSVEEGSFYFSLSFPIYIYSAIYGFKTVKEAIPFSIKIGATRKNLFLGIGLLFLGLAIVQSLIGNTLHSLTLSFTEATDITTFNFLHLSSFLEDTWLNRVAIDAAITFVLLVLLFFFGLLFYQTGLAGGGIVAGVIVLALLLGIAKGWVFDFLSNLFTDINITYFLQLFVIGLVLYAFTFLFVRKITIVKAK
ncbi:hypothetical protein [Radiobacillus sp. PE A8.2]|uniref:hypothetical protein n=1 Tax=Radiobacillus sp. PE A8.2 TaxID=3380349 RepID=UPI003890DE74